MYIGTQSENMRDMYTRGRHPVKARKGDDHPSKKLSSMQVSWIRQLRGKGFSQRQLARFFGVHEGSVSAIIRGITWKQA
jgi:DNA-binding transcriptional regulator YiaG